MIKTIVNNTEKEIEQIRTQDGNYVDYVEAKIGDIEYEGDSPLSFKSIGNGLQNYRIYGNTELINNYLVALFDTKTSNLFYSIICYNNYEDKKYWNSEGTLVENQIYYGSYRIDVTPGTTITRTYTGTSENYFFKEEYDKDTGRVSVSLINIENSGTEEGGVTITVPDDCYTYVFNIPLTIIPDQIFVVEGSTPPNVVEPYGYRIPLSINGSMINIYSNSPIMKCGNKVDYIDYQEKKIYIETEAVVITGNTNTASAFESNDNGMYSSMFYPTVVEKDDSKVMCLSSHYTPRSYDELYNNRNTSNYEGIAITSKEYGGVIYLVDNVHGFNNANELNDYLKELNRNRHPLTVVYGTSDYTYTILNEYYIPSIPTVSGTNLLSINTMVQPSKIYVKDNYEYQRIFTGTREIDGVPEFTYKSLKGINNTLDNYQIYGNTNSVGDKTNNLFDEQQQFTNGIIDSNGTINTSLSGDISDYIQIDNTVNYIVSLKYTTSKSIRIAFYDSNKNFISLSTSSGVNISAEINSVMSSGATYIRLCMNKGWSQCQLEVGSVATEYEPYGYRIPVVINSKNLFDASNKIENTYINTRSVVGGNIVLASYDTATTYKNIAYVTANKTYTLSYNINVPADTKARIGVITDINDVVLESRIQTWKPGYDHLTITPSVSGYLSVSVDANSTDLQIEEGSSATAYEQYFFDNINIYIPNSLRKINNTEIDYIDYSKQKLFRFRKNLWDENYENISTNTFTYKPVYVGDSPVVMSTTTPLTANDKPNLFLFPGNVNSGAEADEAAQLYGVTLDSPITATPINGYVTVAYIAWNNINPEDYNTQIEKGSSSTSYEPYIENPEINISLPSIPVKTGTNKMNVNTVNKPYKVKIKGKIKQ